MLKKIPPFLITICLFQSVLTAQRQRGVDLTEEKYYHELKDSLSVYRSRLKNSNPDIDDILNLVFICNTATYYDPILKISKTFGYNEQKKQEIDSLRLMVKGTYNNIKPSKDFKDINKVTVYGNDFLYVKYNEKTTPNAYLYCVKLNMYKQNKIINSLKCIDAINGVIGHWPKGDFNMSHVEQEDHLISKQVELWRGQDYFLPIGKWVNLVPENLIKAFLKVYGL